MPKVIQFTNQLFDYGVERFFPEKVTVVRASTLDSRFITSHGRYCIIADDSKFVTHVGIELGKAPRYYVENELDWDFTYYDDPMVKAPEEDDDEGEKEGDDDGKKEGGDQDLEGAGGEEGSVQPGEQDSKESDGEGSKDAPDGSGDSSDEDGEGEGSEEGDSDPGGEGAEDEVIEATVIPSVSADLIDAKSAVREDEVVVEPVEAAPKAEPELKPEPKATPKKKGGGKGKKK